MSLSFGLSPWLLFLCALAAAGLTYWAYQRMVPQVSSGRKAVLIGLRFVTLFLVLFLLFEPVWRMLLREERPPVLAVLVDDSQSLGLQIALPDTLDLAADTRNTIRALPNKGISGDVRFFAFSQQLRTLPDDEAADSLSFLGQRTDISRALDEVRDQLEQQNLRGILLISDGQYNAGRNPLYQAERSSLPIHTVVVGDTLRRRDLQVRRILTNDIAYLNAALPVQVGLRTEGFPGEQVVVSLFKKGVLLDSKPLSLPEGTAEVPVEFLFTPQEEGLQQLTVTVTNLEGEVTHLNNSATTAVRVLEKKRKILLMAAAPGPDLAALRQMLDADTDTEVVSFVQKGTGLFYEGNFSPSFEEIDLIVLAGFPGVGAPPPVMERLASAAEEGKPLLFLLSRQTDLRLLETHFKDALPVLPERQRPGFDEASFAVTAYGEQHPLLGLSRQPASLASLPPLYYNPSRWQTSPDAQVLATINIRGVRLDDPLLVIRRRLGNRSAALLGTGTWRWKNLPEDLEAYADFWPSLFSNLVQWLATPENNRRVRVEPVEEIFGGGEPIQFTGQVYDESLNPVSDASLTLEVTAPDSTIYPFTMDPVGNGQYRLEVGTLPEGTYQYQAEARQGTLSIGTDEGTFAVGTLDLEFKETQANVALMRQIAQRSGGIFFERDQLSSLPDILNASGSFASLTYEEARETELWRLPFLVLVILVLLTTEWVLRKRSGMV